MIVRYKCSISRCHNLGVLVTINGHTERRCSTHMTEEAEVLELLGYDFTESLAEECNRASDKHEKKYGL